MTRTQRRWHLGKICRIRSGDVTVFPRPWSEVEPYVAAWANQLSSDQGDLEQWVLEVKEEHAELGALASVVQGATYEWASAARLITVRIPERSRVYRVVLSFEESTESETKMTSFVDIVPFGLTAGDALRSYADSQRQSCFLGLRGTLIDELFPNWRTKGRPFPWLDTHAGSLEVSYSSSDRSVLSI